ncbi:MAG: 4Fe-4S binding protein [Candidatus Fermentibacteraceae bacterium]
MRTLPGVLRGLFGSGPKRAEGYPGRGLRGRARPLRRAVVDADGCRCCGTCASICYYRRIRVRRGTARVLRGCQGCGACARECPEDAIAMVST